MRRLQGGRRGGAGPVFLERTRLSRLSRNIQAFATRDDIVRLLGDIDDETATAVLNLTPTIAEIEEAAVWLDGGSTVFRRGHPQNARLAQILDLVESDDEEPRYLR